MTSPMIDVMNPHHKTVLKEKSWELQVFFEAESFVSPTEMNIGPVYSGRLLILKGISGITICFGS